MSNKPSETTGNRIYKLRNKYGISQHDLASLADISEDLLKKYEKNILTQIPFAELEKMAAALHTSVNYLLYGEAGVFKELTQAKNHRVDGSNLYDNCIGDNPDAIELFWSMQEKTPDEKDIIMDSGAFHEYIEGYMTLALRYIGYPESEINYIRTTLRRHILLKVSSELARKTGSELGISRNAGPVTDKDETEYDDNVIYPFPFYKKDLGN